LTVFCGIDWAERHHDVALVDVGGQLVSKRRISDNVDGFLELLDMLATAGDSPDDPIPVAIETSRGLLVAALRATGRKVYAINPMAVARYRVSASTRAGGRRGRGRLGSVRGAVSRARLRGPRWSRSRIVSRVGSGRT
jgi:Transposase